MMIKVKLVGFDGKELHGEGMIDSDIISERHLVERNKHVYAYDSFMSNNLRQAASIVSKFAVFRECTLPYVITEF